MLERLAEQTRKRELERREDTTIPIKLNYAILLLP
jgi:hypothetical protein